MRVTDVTDLEVYQESLKLLKEIYKLVAKLPDSERDTKWQLQRASKSIPAQIAEGFGKRHFQKEFRRYLLIAIGSSDEIVTHLRTLAMIIDNLAEESNILLDKYRILSKRLNALHKSWNY
jgi:four helix bundle protein